LERICRYCKETLGLNVVVEGRIKRELPQLTFLVLSLLALLVQKY
jgi:hypothetical protein